jgi:hypothetical protein
LHIYIPENASFHLDPRATHVFVRAELSGEKEQHPQCLIKIFEKDDPARRLGVEISAFASNGQAVSFWGTKDGGQAALYANSIVDWLNKVPLEEIAKRNRRYIHLKSQKFLLKVEEKRRAKSIGTFNKENGGGLNMINEEIQASFPTINRAADGLMEGESILTFELVADLDMDDEEGTTKDDDKVQRLYEAEFETEQEKPQREDKSSASVYSYDTFLAFYCSRNS